MGPLLVGLPHPSTTIMRATAIVLLAVAAVKGDSEAYTLGQVAYGLPAANAYATGHPHNVGVVTGVGYSGFYGYGKREADAYTIGQSLTGFLWPMLTPLATLTMLVSSPEWAMVGTECTTGSERLRRTLSGRWLTGAPGELSLVSTTATDGLLVMELLETVDSAMLGISSDKS